MYNFFQTDSVIEVKYYRERRKGIIQITDKSEQKEIDEFMATHDMLPPYNTAREEGFSSCIVEGVPDVEVNPSMLKKTKIKSSLSYKVERLDDAPALPISCLASAEHVVSMQDCVSDFVSEFKPKQKKWVQYQLAIRVNKSISEKDIIDLILRHNTELESSDVFIFKESGLNVFFIEIPTQRGDIQKIIQGLKILPGLVIQDCNYEDIRLNEGVCFVKADGENPIHALVNIGNTPEKKIFLERDAGQTSGRKTKSYQDNRWTFRLFRNLAEIKESSMLPQSSHAIKLVYHKANVSP